MNKQLPLQQFEVVNCKTEAEIAKVIGVIASFGFEIYSTSTEIFYRYGKRSCLCIRNGSFGWESTDYYERFATIISFSDFMQRMESETDNPTTPIEPQYVPLQLCPKCLGQGTVSKPPFIAGDVHQWASSAASFTCNLCNGAMVIPQHRIN